MRYQSTTGLDSDQIDELVDRIEEIECGRKSGHGRPVVVDLYGQVMIALVLLRQNLNQMAVADLFGISQPTVSRIYRTILPLLEQVTFLHAPDFAEAVQSRVVLVDGTDVPTGNRRDGRENYSGKRHRQGLNIQVGASLEGTLLGVADPVPGCRHDRRAITETGWEDILGHGHWIADPGYLGTTAITPERKPKNGEFDPKTKDNNKLISGIRSAVERCIAHEELENTRHRLPRTSRRTPQRHPHRHQDRILSARLVGLTNSALRLAAAFSYRSVPRANKD